jgi:alkanesulfonate monooxygenase SsuD/methylene tetrahydromethanopterin reductase-like flavin-dependent oxidoreductase (luciferase family)
MSTAVAQPRAAGEQPDGKRPFKLGFHTRISFPTGHAADGLHDGIELFRAGEQLGYDAGWVYQRHFDNYMASPLVYLPVVAQHTNRINLGTAIIGMRYEAPVVMAEAAGTADLLTGGRLNLGLGTGMGGYDTVFGQEPNDGRDQSQARLELFMRGIRGESVGVVNEPAGLLTPGLELTVRPTSPTLPERIWYGAGSVASAERIGGQGLRLMTSTILTDRFDDYNAEQARLIKAYRDSYTGTTAPRVAVSRSILPTTSPELARLYAAYDHERRTQGPAASRPQGALAPTAELSARAFTVTTRSTASRRPSPRHCCRIRRSRWPTR